MITPEGKTKARLDRLLKKYGNDLHAFKPVQNGMGSPALDYIVCYKGRYASIETKAGAAKMAPRQEVTAGALRKAGAAVFLVNDVSGEQELIMWLGSVDAEG